MCSVVSGIVGKPINLNNLPRLKIQKAFTGGITINGAVKITTINETRFDFPTHFS